MSATATDRRRPPHRATYSDDGRVVAHWQSAGRYLLSVGLGTVELRLGKWYQMRQGVRALVSYRSLREALNAIAAELPR